MNFLLRFFVILSFIVVLNTTYISTSYGHNHTPRKQLIIKLKKEIVELGAKPTKKQNFLKPDQEYINQLKKQIKDLKDAKKDKEQIKKVKNEIIEELKKLGAKPITEDESYIDTDEEIVALRKQLEEIKLKLKVEAAKKDIVAELQKLGLKPVTEIDEVDTDKDIIALRKQLDDYKAEEKRKEEEKLAKEEKEKEERIKAAKDELLKELEKLGVKPKVDTTGIDDNAEIVALRKQIEEIKTERKKAADKKKAEKKKIADKKEKERQEAIQNVKKEILFLGETPIPEYEFKTEDKYIEALRKQIEEIRKIKEEEELKINAAIPEWYMNMPKGSETVMYARGTHVSVDLDQSELMAIEQAKIKLAMNLQVRMNAKIQTAAKEAGIDGDLTLKQEFNTISTSVANKVSLNGFKIHNTHMAPVQNNKFRTYIVLEFNIGLAYKAYLKNIENNQVIKKNLNKLKDTEAFKELEQYVSEFTGA